MIHRIWLLEIFAPVFLLALLIERSPLEWFSPAGNLVKTAVIAGGDFLTMLGLLQLADIYLPPRHLPWNHRPGAAAFTLTGLVLINIGVVVLLLHLPTTTPHRVLFSALASQLFWLWLAARPISRAPVPYHPRETGDYSPPVFTKPDPPAERPPSRSSTPQARRNSDRNISR